MKRPVIAAIAFVVAACGSAAPEPLQIERPTAKACPTPDPNRACLADTHDLDATFDRAMAGDYQAQRNTAWALSGASPWVEARPVQACAWRKAIMATRPADAAYHDGPQVEIDCGPLSASEQAQADQIAALILAGENGPTS